ncbi:hypothetical protein [Sedimenticola selenatireducens]|uniref:hypothetical protein n=1 Tax=Sedimenticola selenatireducens TaxID=191960 RepID=UPI0004918AA5|nr:hypothetical protein [Sedimenticola selenatireducens]
MMSTRWAEAWRRQPGSRDDRPLKAMPMGSEAFLTLSSEFRLRYDDFENRQLIAGEDSQPGL